MKKEEIKKWYQSSNFWVAVVMVIAGSFVGFTEGMAETAVGAIFGILAIGKSLHNYFKEAEIDWKSWVLDSNFINYALIVITAFVPTFSPELLQQLQELVAAIFAGNVSGILAAIFSLATILYNIFWRNPEPKVKIDLA